MSLPKLRAICQDYTELRFTFGQLTLHYIRRLALSMLRCRACVIASEMCGRLGC